MAKRLFIMARKHWGTLALATLGLLGATAAGLVTPALLRSLTVQLTGPQGIQMQRILLYVGVLVGVYLLRALCRFVNTYFSHVAAWSFVPDLTAQIYDKLQQLSMRFYHDKQTGQIMSRAINDSRQIEVLVAHALPDLLGSLLTVLCVTVILFTINAPLAALTLIPVPLVVWVSAKFARKVSGIFRECQSNVGDLNAFLQDNLSGMKEIQAFGQEERERANFGKLKDYYSYINIRANFFNGWFHPSVEFLTALGTVIVVGFGGALAIRGVLSAADIVGFVLYLALFYQPIATLARVAEDTQVAFAGAVRVFEILDATVDIQDEPGAIELTGAQGRIDFENVSFSYDKKTPVLQDIDFTVQPGQMVALVGPTGVGKTTIVSLLERFYDPTQGCIRLDGQDTRALTLSSLRANLSLVLQDIFLFNGTIAENIAYGVQRATVADIRAAATIAQADEFISQMPQGYDTVVGERGVRLSGGQKQRIAIARAVLRDTPILILDEATAAVDMRTEAHIQQAIQNLAGSRTLVVIAHRLSTVQRADLILVLEEGRIVERGRHEQLLRAGGLYARLCDTQLQDGLAGARLTQGDSGAGEA